MILSFSTKKFIAHKKKQKQKTCCLLTLLPWCQSISCKVLLVVHCWQVDPENVPHGGWNVHIFSAQVYHCSHYHHRDFPQWCSFYFHIWNAALALTSKLTFASFLFVYIWRHQCHMWLLWQQWVRAERRRWGREKRGVNWVVWRSLANLWPNFWINCMFCFIMCEWDWWSIWDCCEVKRWTREGSVIWMHGEIRAGESPSFRNEITSMYESRSWLFDDSLCSPESL